MSKEIPSVSVNCTSCKNEIIPDIFSISLEINELKCRNCNETFISKKGSYKFLTSESPEEEYYEDVYDLTNITKSDLSFDNLRKEWFSPLHKTISLKFLKYNTRFINHNPADFKNKTILLLGNGVSIKELYLLSLGARIIYTDLSHRAVLYVRAKYDFSQFKDKISFQAIDAENIPLGDESIDYVIGYKFVHHLDDIKPFFANIHRILKKDGFCFFYDSSHSPLWQKLKFSILKPIVNFSHHKSGISPQHMKATHRGGFKKSEIREIKKIYNFQNSFFFRNGFLSLLMRRFMIEIMGENIKTLKFLERFVPLANKIDRLLSNNLNFYNNNTIDLFWGFQK